MSDWFVEFFKKKKGGKKGERERGKGAEGRGKKRRKEGGKQGKAMM